jgi:prevent-host-death family protein
MKTATVREAQHHLSQLMLEVEQGEEIILTRRGKAIARILPMETERKVEFPDFSQLRKANGTDQIKGPNEVIHQRGKQS